MAIDFIRKKSKKTKIRQDGGRGAASRSGSNWQNSVIYCHKHTDQEINFICADTGELLCNHCAFMSKNAAESGQAVTPNMPRKLLICHEQDVLAHI